MLKVEKVCAISASIAKQVNKQNNRLQVLSETQSTTHWRINQDEFISKEEGFKWLGDELGMDLST